MLSGASWRASRLSPNVIGIEPWHPDAVTVRRVEDRLVYDVMPMPWDPKGKRRTFDQDDVLHVPGPNFDGLRGQSQISGALKLSGSLALSADEYMMSFYRNSARPDYSLQTDGSLTEDQINNLRNQVSEQHQGVAKSWKPLVLQGGLKVQPISINPKDAQLLEMRKFQVEDVCRVMGVPPFMIGYTEKTTSWGSGVEQMGIGFVKYTLQRHLVKFEQEINRKVFRTARNFCEFNTAGLERGDTMQRFNAYRIALGRAGEQPWMDVNEIRKLENWEPRDDLVAVGTPSNNPESEPEKKPEGEDANEPAAAPTE
jgi:HK97 family phage portal protein